MLIASILYFTVLEVTAFKFLNPIITPFMIARTVESKKLENSWYSFNEINNNFFKAIIASEDSRFFEHSGFDTKAIIESIKYNRKHTTRKRGASTISMQTAKNTFLLHGRNYLRKAAESYFTFLIEAIWGKKRILEVYANVVEVGSGMYGIGTASDYYFNKEPIKLTNRESALITASLPNPRGWNPSKPTRYLNKRAYTIQARMRLISLKEITDKE